MLRTHRFKVAFIGSHGVGKTTLTINVADATNLVGAESMRTATAGTKVVVYYDPSRGTAAPAFGATLPAGVALLRRAGAAAR